MHFCYHAGTAVLVGLLAAACSSSSSRESGTTGHAINLETQVEIKDDLAQPNTNALGWEVTISKAYLSVGALYYYSGDPVLSQRQLPKSPKRSVLATLGDFMVPPAYAHPGHYIEGEAMGQMLKATTIDLLGDNAKLSDGEGVSGEVNSARITWQSPPKGDLADMLEGHVVLTQGTAAKDEVTVEFVASADATEAVDGNGEPQVSGCAFGFSPGEVGVEMDDDGTVTLTLVPSVWFDQVDFSYVAPGAATAPEANANGVVNIAGTLAWQGFIRGVKKGTAYEFSYEK